MPLLKFSPHNKTPSVKKKVHLSITYLHTKSQISISLSPPNKNRDSYVIPQACFPRSDSGVANNIHPNKEMFIILVRSLPEFRVTDRRIVLH